jgi:hypothetical protein
MLALGEIHTGLLQHSTALAADRVAELLDLVEGDTVLSARRPLGYAVSPDLPTGVDCALPTRAGRKTRAAGALLGRASVTGGRIAQVSVSAELEAATVNRRLPWSHYIARPGRLQSIGRVDLPDVVDGFLRGPFPAGRGGQDPAQILDLDAVATQLLDRVQRSELVDRRAPFRSPRTVLRWAVTVDERWAQAGRALFTVESDNVRTVEMSLGPEDALAARELCEDLALHDWLLTTVTGLVGEVISSPWPAEAKAVRLRPIAEHLLHLWMPGVRVPASMAPVWAEVEQRPGFTRQWMSAVDWIRDQLVAGSVALLQEGAVAVTRG